MRSALRVGDAEVAFVGLVRFEVGARRFVDHLGRHAEVARQRPDLRLVQIADRVHRRRVVGVPGEVAHQPFRLVAGSDRQRVAPRRLVEQHEHAHARHHVAFAARVGVGRVAQVAVDRVGDLDRLAVDAERVDHALRVGERARARRAVRHADRVHVLRAQRARAQVRDQRAVDPARQAEDRACRSRAARRISSRRNASSQRAVSADRSRSDGSSSGASTTRQRRGHLLEPPRHRDLVVEPQVGQHRATGRRAAGSSRARGRPPRDRAAPCTMHGSSGPRRCEQRRRAATRRTCRPTCPCRPRSPVSPA